MKRGPVYIQAIWSDSSLVPSFLKASVRHRGLWVKREKRGKERGRRGEMRREEKRGLARGGK